MKMAGFTAEASLCEVARDYQRTAIPVNSASEKKNRAARALPLPGRTGLTLALVHKPAASPDGREHQAVAVCQKPSVQPKHAIVRVAVACGVGVGYLPRSNGIHTTRPTAGRVALGWTFDSAR